MHRFLTIGLSAVLFSFATAALAQPTGSSKAKAKAPAAAKAPAEKRAGAATRAPEKSVGPTNDATEAEPDRASPEEKPVRRITVAAIAGVGINETKIKDEAGNELKEGVGTQGVGIGIRGGYTLPIKIYVGAAFVYHLGGSKDKDQVKYSGSTLYLGPEVGYDLDVGPVIVRPYVGLGYGTAKAKAEVGGNSIDRSEGGLAFWPGVMARYPIDAFFVGADARYALVTGTDKITNAGGVGVFATVGMSF